MIIEIVMILAAVVLAVKVATVEQRSSWLWGGLMLVLCIASLFQPYLPFLRILIVTGVVIVLMMVLNATRK